MTTKIDIVTAPIDKHALLAGGYDYPGHTEMLAELTGRPVAMMLASDKLRVVLATTHIALRDVPTALTVDTFRRAFEVTRAGLRDQFGIAEPRLALCALNPHAGEHGLFGREEMDVLEPAVAAVSAEAGPPGRSEMVSAGQPFTVIVDFAHTGPSLAAAIGVARSLAGANGRVLLVTGAAGERDPGRRTAVGQAAGGADLVWIADDGQSEMLVGSGKTPGEAIADVDPELVPSDGELVMMKIRSC